MSFKVNWVPYISKNLDEILSSDMVLPTQYSIQNYTRKSTLSCPEFMLNRVPYVPYLLVK